MAEGIEKEKDHPSKIPRYSKSKIPVLSTEYKNTLRNVSNKKSKVEEYRNKITLMKDGMHECRRKVFLDSDQNLPPCSKIVSGASTTSRNVVHTPGGTKRKGITVVKISSYLYIHDYTVFISMQVFCSCSIISVDLIFVVRPSYVKFKAELKDVLGHMVCKKQDSIIMVDDLVDKIYGKFPGVKGFERGNILKTISLLYGKKVEYMGKKKR